MTWLWFALQASAVWAGHEVLTGERDIPLIGTQKTRSDSFVLATVEESKSGYVLEQRLCAVDMAKVAKVTTKVPPSAIQTLPGHQVVFTRTAGNFVAEWSSGWNEDDHEKDGSPGLSVLIEAPMCSGAIHVASLATSNAKAVRRDGALAGEVTVQLAQKVLGASNLCLRVASGDTRQTMRGAFRYVPVKAGSTCADLLKAGWPVRAGAPVKVSHRE